MSEWVQKRFWKAAQVVETESGHSVLLDGRGIKTPAKASLVVPTKALALAIADEWDAQEDVVKPQEMPCTRTANAAIDKVTPQFAEVADMLAAYGDADLLCYRATGPAELIDRQDKSWTPLLDWIGSEFGVALETFGGVIHTPQNANTLAELTRKTYEFSAFELAAFHDLVSLSGSLVIGFAATSDARPIQQLWEISCLDEIWQKEQWGTDEDAEAGAGVKAAAFVQAKRFYDLCQPVDN